MSSLSKRRKAYDRSLRTLLYLCAGITCALLLFLIGYIFYRGLGNISWEPVSYTHLDVYKRQAPFW